MDVAVKVPGPHVLDMDQSPDGNWIGLVGGSEIRLWHRPTGQWRHWTLTNTALGSRSAAFSPDSKFLAVGEHDSRVRLWKVADFPVLKPDGEGR